MRTLVFLLVSMSLGATSLAALAEPALEPGVAEVRECAERNFPKHSARQKLVLERSVAGSDARMLEATLLWKRGSDGLSRVRVTVDAPPAERGIAFLLIERTGEDDMFTYLPEFKRVRRITSRAITGSFLGSDLSYEDFQQLQGFADHAKISRLPDGEIGGRPTYVLEAASTNGGAYEHVRSYFDHETCVLLRAELTGRGVEREVEVAWPDVERVGERWVPRRLLLRDQAKQSETRLSIRKTEWDIELADSLFSERQLAKGH